MLLMMRLGVRASEVAALTLEDIDWRAGVITVRGKGSRIVTAVEAAQEVGGSRRQQVVGGEARDRFQCFELVPAGPVAVAEADRDGAVERDHW
jgi:hypothetical protein